MNKSIYEAKPCSTEKQRGGIGCQDDVDPEDFDYFIQELQELIKDSPSTMQARFAKVIVSLRQRKSEIKEVLNSYFKDKESKKKRDPTIIFQAIEDQVDGSVTKEELHSLALRMAQTREQMAKSSVAVNKKATQVTAGAP